MRLAKQPAPSAAPEDLKEVQVPRLPLSLSSQSALRLVEFSALDSPMSVLVFGPDGVCGWANPASAALLGVSHCGELVGRLDLRRHCSVPGDTSGAALAQALRGQDGERLPLCYDLGALAGTPEGGGLDPRAQGKTLVVYAQLVPLLDEYGAVVALCVFNQTTGQGTAQSTGSQAAATTADREDARMRHSIATARRLAQSLAHDFNNIIAVVQGYAELLQGRLTQDKEGRDMAEMIRQMGEEAAAVTTRLAAFASAKPLDPVEVDLNQVVRDFLARPQGAAPPGVEVRLELAADSPPLLADQARLEQVCGHLWQNALDAMPQGGRICWQTELVWEQPQSTVAAHQPQAPFLRLRVTDTGVGMDEATCRLIFDPFFTTKHGRSRGLGLTEVYETVQAHNGFVEVSSVQGSGTSLDLYFPVQGAAEQAQARPVAERQATATPEAAARQGGRWLVADDNRLVRLLLEQLLAQAGHEVVAAASGREALAIYQLQGTKIDGVILDLDLGDMTGSQVFQRLREINRQVRVIVLSGDPLQPAVGELMAQGGWGVLAKPFRREDLAGVVNQAAAAWAAPAHRAAAA